MKHLAFLACICIMGFQIHEIKVSVYQRRNMLVYMITLFAYLFHALWVCAYIFNLSIKFTTPLISQDCLQHLLFLLFTGSHVFTLKAHKDDLILFHANLARFQGLRRRWSATHLWSPQSCLLHCALPWWRRTPGPRRWPQETARRWGKCSSCLEPGPWWGRQNSNFPFFFRWHQHAPHLLQCALIVFGMIGQNVVLCPTNRLPFHQERDVGQLDQPQSLRAEDWEENKMWGSEQGTFFSFLFHIKITHSQRLTKKGQIRFHV